MSVTIKDESMGGDGDEEFEEIRRIIVEITVESLSNYCPITGFAPNNVHIYKKKTKKTHTQ